MMFAAATVLAVVAAAFLLAGGGPDEEPHGPEQAWAEDLDEWAHTTMERLGPDAAPAAAGHDLAAVFAPAWTEPVRLTPDEDPGGGASWEQVDGVNATCTVYTSYDQSVQEAVPPPAAPSQLDTDDAPAPDSSNRFTDYQRALADLQGDTAEAGSTARTFCGTYGTLATAHAEAAGAWQDLSELLTCTVDGCELLQDDADSRQQAGDLLEAALVHPNEQIAAALSAQCYLPGLEAVCAADAAEARTLAEAYGQWATRLGEPPAAESWETVQEISADAAAGFPEVADPWGGTREDAGEAVADRLTQIGATLTQSAERLAGALSP